MLIRNANRVDLPVILELMNFAILNSTAIYDYKCMSYEDIISWFEKKVLDRMPVFVGELDGEVIGFGTYGSFRAREAYKFSVEHSIYLKGEFQGKGYGKSLLQHLITTAQQQGYHTMIAGIDSENTGSIEFHKRAGFIEVGRLKDVGYKFDRWLHLVFMQIIL